MITESYQLIGRSPLLRRALQQVEQVARTDSTVLLLGETGTGKDLLARAIHQQSARRQGEFVRFDCSAVPLTLVESELFGHERGAFTGAHQRRIGRFEQAHEGTLFIDEVGELPLESQPKLLRLIQERQFERLGSNRTERSNARLVAATHCDLAKNCDNGTFRRDLYYRLHVFPISLPPLRERRDDIPELVLHFVEHFARQMKKRAPGVNADTMAQLARYPWPGNIRELHNVVERAMILTEGATLDRELCETLAAMPKPDASAATEHSATTTPASERLDEVTRAHIQAVLRATNGLVAGPGGAATRLGVKRSTLLARMHKLGIPSGRAFRGAPVTLEPSPGE